jgi:hypothetical protein
MLHHKKRKTVQHQKTKKTTKKNKSQRRRNKLNKPQILNTGLKSLNWTFTQTNVGNFCSRVDCGKLLIASLPHLNQLALKKKNGSRVKPGGKKPLFGVEFHFVFIDLFSQATSILKLLESKGESKNRLTNLLENVPSLVRMTERVKTLQLALNKANAARQGEDKTLSDIWDTNHLLTCAQQVLEKALDTTQVKHLAIIFAHKKQGKSQLLFFLMKLLQALGEPVILVDKSIIPKVENRPVEEAEWCLGWWFDPFAAWLGKQGEGDQVVKEVKDSLETYKESRLANHFYDFFLALKKLARKHRIWLLADEVGKFFQEPGSKVKLLDFPTEQDPTPFLWILTGSIGIGEFVARRHLRPFVWDIPVFDKEQSHTFTLKLAEALNLSLDRLCTEFSVQEEGLADFLYEHYGGIVGHIEECLVAFSNGQSFIEVSASLSEQVREVSSKSAARRYVLCVCVCCCVCVYVLHV